MRRVALCFTCLTLVTGLSITADAQKYEIHPYAGAFFPGKFAGVLEMENAGIYGVKAGVYIKGALETEGHFGYIRNVAFDGTLTRKKGYLWEGIASYNFTLFHLHPKFYGAFGLGGFTTSVSADSKDFWGASIPTRDSFLTLSYGGGIKALRQWGPVGYRADVRMRTLPDYYGFRLTWPEVTAGLTFSSGGNQ